MAVGCCRKTERLRGGDGERGRAKGRWRGIDGGVERVVGRLIERVREVERDAEVEELTTGGGVGLVETGGDYFVREVEEEERVRGGDVRDMGSIGT